jgi:hypothetical protein
MQVVLSIRAGRLSSTLLLRRLGTESRKNNIYKAFRELGRVIRTITLLRYISEPELREEITAATNKVESYNEFSAWLRFGHDTIERNDPAEQEKIIKFNTLLANCVIFHTALDMTTVLRQLAAEGLEITPAAVAALSPYIRERIKRFGEYATDGLSRDGRSGSMNTARSPALGSASRFESSSDRCLPDGFCSRSRARVRHCPSASAAFPGCSTLLSGCRLVAQTSSPVAARPLTNECAGPPEAASAIAGAIPRRLHFFRDPATARLPLRDAGRMRSYQGRPRSALRGPTYEDSATWADRATSSLAGSSRVAPPCPDSPDAPMPCPAGIPPGSSIDIAALPGSTHQHRGEVGRPPVEDLADPRGSFRSDAAPLDVGEKPG